MKKTLVILLILITVISNTAVFATESVPSASAGVTASSTPASPSNSAEPNITPTTAPITATPTGIASSTDTPSTSALSSPTVFVPAATPTVPPTPTITPSIEPPMIFSVATVDGATSLVLSEIANSATKLVFSISPKGDSFSENFTIQKIVNTSNKYIYDYNRNVEKGSKGWEYTTDVTFTGTDAGQSITFELHWIDFSGATRIEKAQIKIDEPVPKLSITTTSDGPIVPGVPVNIKYTIQNIGNVTLKNILLADETVSYLNSGEVFTSDEFLIPGGTIEKTTSVIVDGEITLSPKVSFTYKDSTQIVNGEELSLKAQEVIPTLSLTCENYIVENKGSVQKFKYTITNTTQVPLTNILIYDSDANDARLVGTVQSLDIGQTYNGSYDLSVTKSGYYKFKIHYNYQGADMNKQQFAKTDKPIKLPNEVFFDIINVTPETLTGPGKMTFTILVENDTVDELRDLTLSESNNLFERITLNNMVVPAALGGETGKLQYDFTVDIPLGTTQIKLALNYIIGGEVATLNATRDIIITESYTAPPTETVTPTATPDLSGNNQEQKNKMLFWIWICIFILLFILVLIIVLIIVRNNLKKKPEPLSVKRKMTTSFDDYENDFDIFEDFDAYDESEDSVIQPTEEELPESVIITDADKLDEEFAEEFDDDYDDEGVKIYKSKK